MNFMDHRLSIINPSGLLFDFYVNYMEFSNFAPVVLGKFLPGLVYRF